ncbi:hypothetical protein G9X66_17715 [Rhizobium indigoferae]|nr:hypothetical protein [Rhizobium indigoferae]
MENWIKIPGWPYEVSNLGNVKNLRTGRIVRRDTAGGSCRVTLSRSGDTRRVSVARIPPSIAAPTERATGATKESPGPSMPPDRRSLTSSTPWGRRMSCCRRTTSCGWTVRLVRARPDPTTRGSPYTSPTRTDRWSWRATLSIAPRKIFALSRSPFRRCDHLSATAARP